MNRRDVLKGLGAALTGVVVPMAIPKPLQKDARVEELEQLLNQRETAWEALSKEWDRAFNQWQEIYSEVCEWYTEKTCESIKRGLQLSQAESENADLAVEVAYWKEQYEQSLECCDRWREKAQKPPSFIDRRFTQQETGTIWFVDSSRPDDTGDGKSLATAKRTEAAMWAARDALPKSDCSFEIRIQHEKCQPIDPVGYVVSDGLFEFPDGQVGTLDTLKDANA